MSSIDEHNATVPPPRTTARSVSHPRTRLWAGLILGACLAILLVSAWLRPDPHGYGTHQQLPLGAGSGPCGMLVMTGYPCPTCGMTTAFAHTVRGQLLRAAWAQPAGLVLALATVGMACVAGWTLVRGRWPRVRVPFVTPYRVFFGLLVLLLGGWALKIVFGLGSGDLPYR